MRMSRSLALMLAVAVLVPARGAWAANGNKPRIAVTWTEGACATIVDQSTDPVVHFEYSLLEEDDPLMRTEDEVEDSRTHQFLAFAKQDYRSTLPVWISRADIDRAALVDPAVQDLVAAGEIPNDEILEETGRFASGEWTRVTPDDARVPITFAQAEMGVDWDTTGVSPGTYQIWGYTWEPILNVWQRRPGFIKVIASSSEAAAAGPSIAILPGSTDLFAGTPYTLPGCADVPEGSTVTLEWGENIGTLEPVWQPVLEDESITSGALAVEFVPPDEAAGKAIKLRAIVTDAQGRTYTAYAPSVFGVGADQNPGTGDDDGNGSCAVGNHAAPWWLLLLPGLRIRRRRRDTAV